MIDKKENARPTVGAAGQAERESHWASGNSRDDSNTWNGPISSLLMRGQENAIPLRQIVKLTGINGRVVRGMISEERLNGTPILSDNATGYYLPAIDEEKERFIRSMKHRAGEILRVVEAVEKMEWQENVEGWNG